MGFKLTPTEESLLKEVEQLRIPEAEPSMSKLNAWNSANFNKLVRCRAPNYDRPSRQCLAHLSWVVCPAVCSDPKNKAVMGTLTFFSAMMATFPLVAFAFTWIVCKHMYGGENLRTPPRTLSHRSRSTVAGATTLSRVRASHRDAIAHAWQPRRSNLPPRSVSVPPTLDPNPKWPPEGSPQPETWSPPQLATPPRSPSPSPVQRVPTPP
jgi:hypothetical protein